MSNMKEELKEAWKEFKLFHHDFDKTTSQVKFLRSIRPIILFTSFLILMSTYEKRYNEDIVKSNQDVALKKYGYLKNKWIVHYYRYLDVIPIDKNVNLLLNGQK